MYYYYYYGKGYTVQWNPPYDHPVNMTTMLIQALFCVPNESPDISLLYNLVNLTTPFIYVRPTTTFSILQLFFFL